MQIKRLIEKVMCVVLVNLISFYILRYFFAIKSSACVMVLTMAAFLSMILYQMLFFIGSISLQKLSSKFCSSTNILYLATLEAGSSVSQPSTMHRYWMMHLDIPIGHELHITGKINYNNQKYWSCIVYDVYGIPLPQYVFDENVKKISLSTRKTTYDFDICITPNPELSMSDEYNAENCTVIDISKKPKMAKGYVLFRLVHPSDTVANVEQYSAPISKLRPFGKRNSNQSLDENIVSTEKTD